MSDIKLATYRKYYAIGQRAAIAKLANDGNPPEGSLMSELPEPSQRAPGRAEAPPPRVNTPEFQQALYGHALRDQNERITGTPLPPEPQRAPGRAEAPPPRVNTPEFQRALDGHALRDQNEMTRALMNIDKPYSGNDYMSEMPVMPEKQRAPGRAEAPPPRVNTPEFQRALYEHARQDQDTRSNPYFPPEPQRAPGRAEAPPPRVNTPEFQRALYEHARQDQDKRSNPYFPIEVPRAPR
jgi:hypothetical protein